MRRFKPLAAALALLAATGCGQAPSAAVAPATQARGTVEAMAKGAGKPMSREQARALVAVLDKNGDGQLSRDEGHMTLLWGEHDYAENKGSILDPGVPFKPLPAAMVIEKLGTAGAKILFSGAVGYKDQQHVKMAKADIERITQGVAKILAQGPDVQRGRIPVRHVINRHFIFRPGKDVLRWESPRWVAGTMADLMENPNNGVTIESGGQHADGAYQFYFYEHKTF